ncbi:MAG: NAD(P)-binding protein, partial [Bacteroidota bacterium]
SPLACRPQKLPDYPYSIHNDAALAHQIYLNPALSSSKPTIRWQTQNLIIGGGLAGLSAAYHLKNEDYYLVELSDRLGGSASAGEFKHTRFAQGAHYDLNYPAFFGKPVLKMLESLKIIQFNPLTNYWDFRDKSYVIAPHQESRSFVNNTWREALLPDIREKRQFYEILEPYLGHMLLPSPSIDKYYHHLNQISFLDFLEPQMALPREFKKAIDYQMRDDYGGNSEEVSALAGVFYYTSRPEGFNGASSQIFSPPQGNAYFVEQMINQLDAERIKNQHLVRRIYKNGPGFQVEGIDLKKKQPFLIQCQQIIYAAQKQGLPYIYPADKDLFKDNRYIPWLSLNFILKKDPGFEAFWQNEFPDRKDAFIGFVDSKAQSNPSPRRVFTVYYCLAPQDRGRLLQLDQEAPQWIHQAVSLIARYFDWNSKDLHRLIEKVFLKAMGHAMPLPYPGYLFQEKNQHRSTKNLVYAGVDNSRLPLLFEALDSGYRAVEELNKS